MTYPNFYHPDEKTMKKVYGDDYKKQDGWELLAYPPNLKTVEDNLFHINDRVNDKPVETLVCICGSKEFNVGQDTYFTAIRCIKCGLEMCVHEG